MRLKPATAFAGAVLTVGLAVAGCSSQTGGSSTASTATASASPSVTVSTSQPSTSQPSTSQPSTATDDATDDNAVDANTASKSEIEAALTEAGVPNTAMWADEIVKYRPYTAEDLEAKLTQELGKSNVDQATLTKILSVLTID